MNEITNSLQREEFRNKLIFTLPEKFKAFLEVIESDPQASRRKIQEKTKYSNGTINNVLKDAKIMKLVSNGSGLHLTEDGKEWLNSCRIRHQNKPQKEVMMRIFLNVPFFSELFANYKDVNSPKKIFGILLTQAPKNIDQRIIVSATKRYFEVYHNINAKLKGVYIPKKNLHIRNSIMHNIPLPNLKIISKGSNGVGLLKELKITYGLTPEEITKMLNSLPEEKKKIIQEKIIQEYLNS